MRSFASAMALLSCGYLVVAIVWPHVAERMLQMLLATLALGLVGARVYRSSLPARMTHDGYSPFDRRQESASASKDPAAIRDLTARLGAAADADRAQRAAIPGDAAETVRAEVSRRLTERHGLSLHDPGDHPQVRELLSEPTWALIHPLLRGVHPEHGSPALRGAVPLSELGRILDDLERL